MLFRVFLSAQPLATILIARIPHETDGHDDHLMRQHPMGGLIWDCSSFDYWLRLTTLPGSSGGVNLDCIRGDRKQGSIAELEVVLFQHTPFFPTADRYGYTLSSVRRSISMSLGPRTFPSNDPPASGGE